MVLQGLARSMFERLIEEDVGDVNNHMLTPQFRMNGLIMQWVSETMYQGKLMAHFSVKYQGLKHLKVHLISPRLNHKCLASAANWSNADSICTFTQEYLNCKY